MPDTKRPLDDFVNASTGLFKDNTSRDISAQDLRDFVTSAWNPYVTSKTDDYSAVHGDLVVMSLSGTSKSVTLPTSPAASDRIGVFFAARTGSETVTINGNGKNINGSGTVTLDAVYECSVLQFDATADEWRVIVETQAPITIGDPVVGGTANRVLFLSSAGGAVLDDDPNLTWDGTTFSVTGNVTIYTGVLTLTGFAEGQLLFPSSAAAVTSSSNLVWNNTSERLGIRTTPSTVLHLLSATLPSLLLQATSAVSPAMEIRDGAGTANRWLVYSGVGTTTDGKFGIIDFRQNLQRIVVDASGNVIINGTGIASGTKSLVLGGFAASPTLPNATADSVSLSSVDNGAGNRELQIQPESGSKFALGNNLLRIPAGGSSDDARVGGLLTSDITSSVGNVGTGEDDLKTYTVAASTLATNGDSVWFEALGQWANNSNAKTLRVRFGSSGTTEVFSYSLPTSVAGYFVLRGRIIRESATVQTGYVEMTAVTLAGTSLNSVGFSITLNQTLSGAVTLRITGEATSNNDILCIRLVAGWHPNNT